MPEKTVHIVSAFTANGEHGNPAGIVLDADDLNEVQMLSIAQRVGLSETTFVSESATADRQVRFFATTGEVDVCGHATIATWSLLKFLNRVSAGNYTQQTKAGSLGIDVQNELVFMQQKKPHFGKRISSAEVSSLLGISQDDIDPSLPPQIVSTGLRDVMVPVVSGQVLRQLRPQTAAMEAFSTRHDSYSFHVFTPLSGESLAAVRNFDPAHGIPEESATGTSNGGLLCYLRRYGRLPVHEVYRIEQGEAMGQLSYVYGKFIKDTVWVGGSAIPVDQRLVAVD